MLVLIKKRIILVWCMICVSLCTFSLKIADNLKQTVETVSIPATGKVVIVDAGHGSPDEGAESENGVTEAGINLKIALKLQALLEQSGSSVILTRTDENGIYDSDSDTIREKKVSDTKKRVEIANNSNADIFVSIHLNKIDESKYYGWQTFYKQGSDESKNLAEKIQSSLNNSIQRENNRKPAVLNNVYIMKYVEIPICLVECGFLSNPEEEELLQTDEYQEKLAWGIYIGINDYFEN